MTELDHSPELVSPESQSLAIGRRMSLSLPSVVTFTETAAISVAFQGDGEYSLQVACDELFAKAEEFIQWARMK